MEIWKDIKGYEGKYQVSTHGNIKSLNYNNTGKEKILKPKINRYGYYEVKLSKNNKTKNYLVGTLVANTFLKKKADDLEVMHIGDSQDNSVNNLRYAYRSQILYAMYKRGRKGKASNNTISYNGKTYRDMSKMARDNNLQPKLLLKRIENGWLLKEALEIPANRENKILNVKLYKYNDKLYSIKQLVKINKIGISDKTLRKRLARGWSIEEAMEIPITKGGKNGI